MADTAWTGNWQPMAGFPVGTSFGQTPTYSGFKSKSKDTKGLPSFKGIDFQTGKTVDLADYWSSPSFGIASSSASAPSPTYDTTSALGNALNTIQIINDIERTQTPWQIEKYRRMSDIAAEQQLKQAYQLYPLLSQAGAETTERALDASTRFLTRKEQMPSNIGQLMALKQEQATSAAAGEVARARAVADQQDAANRYGGRFAGQFIQVG